MSTTYATPTSHYIHVNPPSFVRSLRHFDIAENLRPGDENLRYLTVTSRLKKLHIFLAINSEAQPNFRAFSTFCFSAGAQRYMVGEIIRGRSGRIAHLTFIRIKNILNANPSIGNLGPTGSYVICT